MRCSKCQQQTYNLYRLQDHEYLCGDCVIDRELSEFAQQRVSSGYRPKVYVEVTSGIAATYSNTADIDVTMIDYDAHDDDEELLYTRGRADEIIDNDDDFEQQIKDALGDEHIDMYNEPEEL